MTKNVVSGTFSTGSNPVSGNASDVLGVTSNGVTMSLTITGLDASNTVKTQKRTAGGAWSDQTTYTSNQTAKQVTVVGNEEWRLVGVTQQAYKDIQYKLDLTGLTPAVASSVPTPPATGPGWPGVDTYAAAVAAAGTIKLRRLVAAIQARYRAARNFNCRTRAPMLNPAVGTAVTFTGALTAATSGTLTAAYTNGTFWMLFSEGSTRLVTITGGTGASWTDAVTATTAATIYASVDTTPVKVKTGASYADVVGSNIHYSGADLVNQSLISARGGFARISGNNVVVESTTVANGVVAGSIDFVFTGRCMVLSLGASNVRTRIKVDGRYISSYQHLAGGSSMALLFDFGASNKPGTKRVISIPMQGNLITDIWVDATGTIQPVEKSSRIIWVSDSKGAFWYRDAAALAAGDTNYLWYGNDTYTRQLADYLGCPDLWPSALPGTGYINANSGAGYVKFRDRIAADIVAFSPDVIVLDFSGDNDTGDTTTEFLASVAQIRAWSATVPIIVYDGNIQQTRAARAAYIAAAAQSLITAGDTYLALVKPITGTPKFTYGTGREGSTTGNGPADWFFGDDDVHNTLTGHDALAIHRADTFVSALESLVA